MSLKSYIVNMSQLLRNLYRIEIDPFTNQKMDFYAYACYNTMIEKLYQGLNYQIRRFCGRLDISYITWLNSIDMDDADSCETDIMRALEDPRDCTMKVVFSLEKLLAAENNIEFHAMQPEKIDKVYMTPNFMTHFDMVGVYDFYSLYHRVRYMSLNLGFMVYFLRSGNAGQQVYINSESGLTVAAFKCGNQCR